MKVNETLQTITKLTKIDVLDDLFLKVLEQLKSKMLFQAIRIESE